MRDSLYAGFIVNFKATSGWFTFVAYGFFIKHGVQWGNDSGQQIIRFIPLAVSTQAVVIQGNHC
ncbi:MAG: hypothetical protein C0630_14635 [Sedimenticola selenatireducens]|uniref:Uncharacterized protein n=1 Tax=Sedimenticola selenatireducens TaxID=191960 RepID=A0A2N6CU72_9GAMM|nr:MAG: hypothetical protein C0630_14635 [Sedimenticola selenatireducens]